MTFCIVLVFIYEIFISLCTKFFVEKIFLLLQLGMNLYSYRRIIYDRYKWSLFAFGKTWNDENWPRTNQKPSGIHRNQSQSIRNPPELLDSSWFLVGFEKRNRLTLTLFTIAFYKTSNVQNSPGTRQQPIRTKQLSDRIV